MSGGSSSIEAELVRLRDEFAKLELAYGRLVWAIDGLTDDLQMVLNLTPLRSRLVAVMRSGKAYTAEQLLHAVWRNDAGVETVKSNLYNMKREFPWFAWTREGGNGGSAYRLTPATLAYIERRLAEAL